MSRELKFRSWNLETKFMYNNIEDGVVAKNQKGEFVLGISFGAICRDANSIVMQFTGLKDKNSKEIYEGDIVNVIGSKRIGLYTTEIIHSGLGFCLKENNTIFKDYKIVSSAIEVIGNIYETPELL